MNRKKPDLDEYLPDAQTLDRMAEPVAYNKNVDPRLLKRLRSMATNPDLAKAPGDAEHVPPTTVPVSPVPAADEGPRVRIIQPGTTDVTVLSMPRASAQRRRSRFVVAIGVGVLFGGVLLISRVRTRVDAPAPAAVAPRSAAPTALPVAASATAAAPRVEPPASAAFASAPPVTAATHPRAVPSPAPSPAPPATPPPAPSSAPPPPPSSSPPPAGSSTTKLISGDL